ncbi:MAG: hypothetical protein DRP74_06780 [Candidatus Omnitrophota bacterium]|nr:MAG: hypothetical protein DRP74_06780 [Candidatus Omnitrophota bacterium]
MVKCKCREPNYTYALILDFILTFFSVIIISILIHETKSLEDWLVSLLNIEELYANMILTAIFSGIISVISAYMSFKLATREI